MLTRTQKGRASSAKSTTLTSLSYRLSILLMCRLRTFPLFSTEPTLGGGARSAELTLPGFVHDICSAVHPFAIASPFWRTLPLAAYGLEWIQPPIMIGHPFDDGSAVVVERSLNATAARLRGDGDAYLKTIGTVVKHWPRLERAVLGPFSVPEHPFALARFGLKALRSAEGLARSAFKDERTSAMFAGIAAHGMMPLDRALTAGIGLTLGAMCHVRGWPIPRGGSQKITNALIRHLQSLGGEVIADSRVTNIDDLPPAKAILCDLSPEPLAANRGPQISTIVSTEARAVSLRHGGVQSGLGARSADSLEGRGMPARGTVHLGGAITSTSGSPPAANPNSHRLSTAVVL